MNIIYSNFDSLYFSMQGALSPNAIKRFERLKEQAESNDGEAFFSLRGRPHRYQMKSTGKKGGYAYVIDTGRAGSSVAFKSSLLRDQHNGFVEISSACLLAYGWREAVSKVLDHVKALGFHLVDVSINRVDYCIDFLDAKIDINPRDFICHARTKKTSYYESTGVTGHVELQSSHVEVRTVSQSNSIKSITLGKMPGRQIIVYDKRAEVIERSKYYWFNAWKVDRRDPTQTVHRVELRAGKKHLMDCRIKNLEDFENHIGLILNNAATAIRWVQRPSTDANVTRAPLHPIWEAVQTHIVDALAPYTAPIKVEVITEHMRENKRLEYKQQIIGNLGGYMGCSGIFLENLEEEMQTIIAEIVDHLEMDIPHPIMKSYDRARERWL